MSIRLTFFLICFFGASSLFAGDYTLNIQTKNLSEDMSAISSKNDEIAVLIYELSMDSAVLMEPLFFRTMAFDTTIRNQSFPLQMDSSTNYLFVLIEQDTEQTLVQLDAILRLHYQSIWNCVSKRDYACIEKYLGDDDVLGIQKFSPPNNIRFRKAHMLDRYDYQIQISK